MALLDVQELRTYFRTDDGIVKAVNNVSFKVEEGEVLGIVGESGSGKSVTSMSIMGLVPQPPGFFPSGQIFFQGRDLLKLSAAELRQVRGRDIAMVFQDPMTSLNPYLTVRRQLTEVLELHQKTYGKAALHKAIEMLEMVGIPAAAKRIHLYPHEFSGGMRQRVMIAMALLCQPKLLIADEPTTALDVTIQAQILELIQDLQKNFGTSVILITHDLGVVAGMADRILVMYAGRVVERASAVRLFQDPRHPYTQGLLASIPRMDLSSEQPLHAIEGLPPDLSNLPSGCAFHPRCALATDDCRSRYPTSMTVRGEEQEGHRVHCFSAAKELEQTSSTH